MTTERQSCRACGSDRSKRLFAVNAHRVRRCLDCSHVYLDVVHTDESIRRMYATYEKGTEVYFEGVGREAVSNFDDYLKRCHECLRSGSPEPRLLDVGCGAGAFLGRARKQGFHCEGVETCEALAQEARRTLGCPVHNGLLGQLDFPRDCFDVVTMYDLIEHLRDPIADLGNVVRWLRPGGVLFVLTPNDGALVRRLARTAFRGSLGRVGRPMQALYYGHHLSYFTARSLKQFAERLELEVVHMETRNQEISRLILSKAERVAIGLLFAVSSAAPSMGGKLLLWARKPA